MAKGRLKNVVIEEIKNLAVEGVDVSKIAKKTGATEKQIERILASDSEQKEEAKSDEMTDSDLAIFWKGEYLAAHAKLVENGIS